MKFIKLFESFSEAYLELEEMCLGTIAYIIDDIEDFKFRIDKVSVPNNKYIKSSYPLDSEIYQVSFFRSEPNHLYPDFLYDNKFKWIDVKDRIIHFIEMVSKKYDITNDLSIVIMTNKSEPIKISDKEEPGIDHIVNVDDIINDNIRNNSELMYIQITIKTKQ